MVAGRAWRHVAPTSISGGDGATTVQGGSMLDGQLRRHPPSELAGPCCHCPWRQANTSLWRQSMSNRITWHKLGL
jgi:hypothetical protein